MSTEIDGVNGIIKNTTSDGDITIKGNDGGSEVSALILDMSDAGTATFNHDIVLGDDNIAKFGDSGELVIYHHNNGSSYIQETGGGDLQLLASNFKVMNAAGTENKIAATTDGAVELYHNNVKKLETTADGVSVSGLSVLTSNTPILTFIESDQSNKTYKIGSFGSAYSIYDESNTQYRYILDTNGNHIFNEGSQDCDFRVESNGNANMLFVDGGNNRVNIGSSTDVAATLVVSDGDSGQNSPSANANTFVIEKNDNCGLSILAATNAYSSIHFGDSGDTNIGQIFYDHSADTMQFHANATQIFTIHTSGVVFNEASNDQNFRVESNNNTNMMFVDAGDDRTHFGGTTHNGHGLGVHNFYGGTTTDQPNLIISSNADAYTDDQIHTGCMRTGTSAWTIARFRSGNASNDAFYDSEFSFRGDGQAYADGSWNAGGADYAEYFEWEDGNSSNEDRIGYSVILDNNKIVKATDSDDISKIIGVISGNPTIVGDNDIDRWKQKYLKDDFGRYIFEDYTITRWTEIVEDGDDIKHSYATDRIPEGITAPSDATVISTEKNKYGETVNFFRKKTNPDWDKDTAYISREDRKEWDTVGLMGKLRLRKGQPTGTNWIKMRDISDTVEEWLVR